MVFGGKRSIGTRTEYMNDILRYDEVLNEWQDVSPTTGDAPAPRSGHV